MEILIIVEIVASILAAVVMIRARKEYIRKSISDENSKKAYYRILSHAYISVKDKDRMEEMHDLDDLVDADVFTSYHLPKHILWRIFTREWEYYQPEEMDLTEETESKSSNTRKSNKKRS